MTYTDPHKVAGKVTRETEDRVNAERCQFFTGWGTPLTNVAAAVRENYLLVSQAVAIAAAEEKK